MSLLPDGLVAGAARPDGRAERLATVEHEIRQAQAEALGRAGERLQGLLERLAAADRELDALLAARPGASPPGAPAVAGRIEARNRLRREALQARHYLIIQREALGLGRHAAVEDCYPIPGRRRLAGSGEPEGRIR
jgi:hypothetical protein